jgi:hypothetical protein
VIGALARPAIARVVRRPRALVTLGAWCALALGMALLERTRGSAHGADHVLVGAFGGLVLPLLSYAFVGALLGARSLSASTAPLVSFGAAPVRAAAVSVGLAVVGCAVLGAVLAAAIAAVAHGSDDPARLADALASATAGALGGGAYGAWFVLGATLGKRGGGRTVLLVVDWLLGLGTSAVAVVVPRAYVRTLLGGAAPLGLPARGCSAALVGLALVCVLLALRRSRGVR